MRVPPEQFRALPLEVHALLADVPLRDVSVVDLPGGGPGRTLADLKVLFPRGGRGTGNPVLAFLFWLRRTLGRVFGWDAPLPEAGSYLSRLSPAVLRASLARPGTDDGGFRILYELPNEILVEARNATVHAFLAGTLIPTETGYRAFAAVYVKPVSPLTPLYMAVIEPFRRFIVYPSLGRTLVRRWRARKD